MVKERNGEARGSGKGSKKRWERRVGKEAAAIYFLSGKEIRLKISHDLQVRRVAHANTAPKRSNNRKFIKVFFKWYQTGGAHTIFSDDLIYRFVHLLFYIFTKVTKNKKEKER